MSEKVKHLTSESFKNEIATGYTLVDFWAEWCGPCRMIAPVVDALAEEWDGKAKFAKLNVDDYGGIAMEYRVQGIPTLILFKDGKEIDRIIGALPKVHFDEVLQRNVK